MVRLDRIYTGGGDSGETSLVGGDRVPKDSERIAAIGDVDEANATIGLARQVLEREGSALAEILTRIQNDMFDLGADLATPFRKPDGDAADGGLRIQPVQTKRLEGEIDSVNEKLEPLTSFVLPGGSDGACRLHLARTVVRRAERAVTALARNEEINPNSIIYLNRLADLLFVMARAANANGADDVLWQPGMTASADGA